VATTALSSDSQVLALLCSGLGLASRTEIKPLTGPEWASLAERIRRSEIERPGGLLSLDESGIQHALDVDAGTALRLHALLSRGGQLALELERLAGRGIWLLTRADVDYPRRFKQRLRTAAPPLLFGVGPRGSFDREAVAIVGSRDADEASLAFASELGRRAAEMGAVVVSGGARGVDLTSMLACAEAGGHALGVLADGLEAAASRRGLRDLVLEGSLTLVSPYHPAARFSVGNAMRRNRLIYCLADIAVVVAADETGGGTRAGAVEALKASWLPVFVRVGPETPPGNSRLQEEGGLPLEGFDLGAAWESAQTQQPVPASGQTTLDVDGAAPMGAPGPGTHRPGEEAQVPPAPPGADSHDLFPVVWPTIATLLAQPMDERALSDALALQLGQARAWLRRAVEEGLAVRAGGPERRFQVVGATPPKPGGT